MTLDPSAKDPPPVPGGTLGYVDLRALEFAKNQPEDMPASEVVARAQEQGLELELASVYRVRERERSRRIVKPKEPPMPEPEASEENEVLEKSPTTTPPQKGKRGRRPGGEDTKAGFVRAQPVDLPAKEVVELAKARGLELSEGYVYTVRAKQANPGKPAAEPKKRGRKPKSVAQPSEAAPEPKKRGRKPQVASVPVPEAAPAPKAPLFSRPPEASAQEVEVEFAKLALEIGLVRADQLLVQLKSKLTEMLRG